MKRTESVGELLLGALGPPLDRRVAARRGGGVHVEGDGGTDAVPVAVALQHRPIGVVEVVRRVGTPPMDGAGVGAGAGAGVVALAARGFCRRRVPGVIVVARALATDTGGGSGGALRRQGELRVEETPEPPARENLRVAVADPRSGVRVRLDVHRGHELSPRAERHHPERVHQLVPRHDSREHRLFTSAERICPCGLGHGRERGVVGGDGGFRDVIGEDT